MKDFTTGNIWRQIVDFTLPMLLGNLFMQLYQFADTAIVGRFIGKEALAAVGASTPVVFMTIALVMGIGIGASIVVSQFFGAKQYDKVQTTIDTLMIFLLAAGAVVTLVGVLFSHQILALIGVPEELMGLGRRYMSVYFSGSILLFGYNAVAGVLRGMGDSLTPLYFLILSALLNVGLDLLFIISFGWGVGGAAWATVISQGTAFFASLWWVNRTNKKFRFEIIRPKFDRAIFRQCLRMGLPSGVQQTFVAIGMVALMGIVTGFGTDIIAAYTAVNRIDAFVAMPVMSFAAALTSFVGQNAGAGKFIRIRRGLGYTLLMSSGFCLVVNTLLILFGRTVLSIFTTDPVVLDEGYELLVILNSMYLIFSVMFVINGMLRGAGATIFPMLMTLLSLWLCRIPAALWFSKLWGSTGIWWAMPVGWAVGLIGAVIYYFSGNWKTKSVSSQRDTSLSEPVAEVA